MSITTTTISKPRTPAGSEATQTAADDDARCSSERKVDVGVSADPDVRARELEEQMTDDERFSLVISVLGHVPGSIAGERDRRFRWTSTT